MNDPQLHLLLSRIAELTARAEAAEAANQRVREVANPDAPMVPTRTVLRALGGADA